MSSMNMSSKLLIAMETQSDNLKSLLDMIAQIEALGRDSGSNCKGVRDIERLRNLLSNGTRPRPKHLFTDNMIAKIFELKISQGKKGCPPGTIECGAVVLTPHEIAFTVREIRVTDEINSVELLLNQRMCDPGLRFTICQNGSTYKGYTVGTLPSYTEKTLAEKLVEDCEFIAGENLAVLIPREILAKQEAEPDRSHPDNESQSNDWGNYANLSM